MKQAWDKANTGRGVDQFTLWETGTQSHWRTLGHNIEDTLEFPFWRRAVEG